MDPPVSPNVMVLCSGFGLGFYIPGLFIAEKLRRLGIRAEVEVFESLLPPSKIQRVEKNRQACHESFRVALASQKVPGDIRDSLDPGQWRHGLRVGKGRVVGTSSAFRAIGCMSWICTER